DGQPLVASAVFFQTGRKESVPSCCTALYNDRQRNDNMRFPKSGNMPFVRIAKMPGYVFLYIYRILLLLCRCYIIMLGYAVEFVRKSILCNRNTVGLHRGG